eukprot:scaffold126793_cov33-Phaeocystis_antarctica.AAC.1
MASRSRRRCGGAGCACRTLTLTLTLTLTPTLTPTLTLTRSGLRLPRDARMGAAQREAAGLPPAWLQVRGR